MKHPVRRKMIAQLSEQLDRKLAFRGAQRVARPLGSVGIVERNESRLAAHGQAHVSRAQLGIHLLAERLQFPAIAVRCKAW